MIIQKFRTVLKRISTQDIQAGGEYEKHEEISQKSTFTRYHRSFVRQVLFQRRIISQEMNTYPQVVGYWKEANSLILFHLILTRYYVREKKKLSTNQYLFTFQLVIAYSPHPQMCMFIFSICLGIPNIQHGSLHKTGA